MAINPHPRTSFHTFIGGTGLQHLWLIFLTPILLLQYTLTAKGRRRGEERVRDLKTAGGNVIYSAC